MNYNPRLLFPPMRGVLFYQGPKKKRSKNGTSDQEYLGWKNCFKFFIHPTTLEKLKELIPPLALEAWTAQNRTEEEATEFCNEIFRIFDENLAWNKQRNKNQLLIEADYKKDDKVFGSPNYQRFKEYEFTIQATQELYKYGEYINKIHKYNRFVNFDIVVHPNDKRGKGLYLIEPPTSLAYEEFKKTRRPIEDINANKNKELYDKYSKEPL